MSHSILNEEWGYEDKTKVKPYHCYLKMLCRYKASRWTVGVIPEFLVIYRTWSAHMEAVTMIINHEAEQLATYPPNHKIRLWVTITFYTFFLQFQTPVTTRHFSVAKTPYSVVSTGCDILTVSRLKGNPRRYGIWLNGVTFSGALFSFLSCVLQTWCENEINSWGRTQLYKQTLCYELNHMLKGCML